MLMCTEISDRPFRWHWVSTVVQEPDRRVFNEWEPIVDHAGNVPNGFGVRSQDNSGRRLRGRAGR